MVTTTVDTLANEPKGTISPTLLRTVRFIMSPGSTACPSLRGDIHLINLAELHEIINVGTSDKRRQCRVYILKIEGP